MILKKKTEIKKKNLFNQIYKFYFYSTIIISFLLLIFFFNSGIWKMQKDKIYDRLNIYGITNYLNLPEIIYQASKGFFIETDKIYIDLNYQQILKLEKNRFEKNKERQNFTFPYDNGSGFPFDYKWSKGIIKLNDNKKEKIRIRLKGAREIHWSDEKFSSYRVELKGEEKIYGTDIFSLQKPRARNYLHEWIFHKLCKELGLAALNYNFINLIKNGENKGLYVFEESFSNELIERNKRRDGPIFSLDEKISVDFKDAEIEVYDKKKWQHLALTKVAAKKIEKLFSGNDVFLKSIDQDLWAKYFAIVDLTQTFHGLLAKSVKYFYNPISGLIEPIGFDGHYFSLSKFDGSKALNKGRYFDLLIEVSNKNKKEFTSLFLNDENFKEKYFFYLNEITKKKFLDEFFNKFKSQIDRNLSLIYSDYYLNDHAFFYGPGIYYFDKKDYYERADFIRKKIKIYKEKIKVSASNNILKVQNYNLNKSIRPIKINCLSNEILLKDFKIFNQSLHEIKVENLNNDCQNIIFQTLPANEKLETNLNFYIKQDIIPKELKNYSNKITKYFIIDGNLIYFKNKITEIDDHVFIPQNYTLHLKPEQEIILNNGSFIFSRANWIYKDHDQKIKIYSKNNSNRGGGIFIFDNKKETILKNLEYFNLGTQNRESINVSTVKNLMDNYNILGSLNFYKTSVKISNSSFFDIYSEDAINIISSNFFLDNNKFHNIKYDAVDFDFTKGNLNNLNFENIGNDAIDFSGSNVIANRIVGYDIKDKFISVGEKSFLKIEKSKLAKSNIGIASKDGSNVSANELDFYEVNYPFASYRKKNEFTGGKLEINNYKLNFFKKKILMDKYSTIKLNGELQKTIANNLLKMIY